MYTEAEFKVLAILRGECTLSELAEKLDRSLSYVSELVTRMEGKNLVYTFRSGKTKRIRRSEIRATELFDGLVQRHQHIPFPELLDGATLQVLYFLDTPSTATELAERADIHRSTVHRSLNPLEDRGLVYRRDETYALNDEFEELATIAKEFGHHRNRGRIEDHVETYTILWESLNEFLVQTNTAIDAEQFLLTGPELFQEYGLPLLSRQRRYYLFTESKEALSAAELCCHMLLIDDGSRSQSYCLLLVVATDIDRGAVRSTAARYDLEDSVSNLLTYLDTQGENRSTPLPTWPEFEALATEYGVDV